MQFISVAAKQNFHQPILQISVKHNPLEGVSDISETLLGMLIFEIKPNTHTHLFIAPPQKLTFQS